jgi:histidyl-tRNA synthetase
MPNIPFPRGVRDLLPNAALFRNELLKRIESVFQGFGFLTIDTPSLESLEVLRAKNAIGEEAKLIYEFADEGIGLRYDHTVSLARYVCMHMELQQPFKRYVIGKCWRREEPQRGRYREFMQADVDIVGGDAVPSDAEVLAAACRALESIGIEYRLRLNNRKLADAAMQKMGVPAAKITAVERAIDKLDKVGDEGVAQLLRGLGLENETVDKITSFIATSGDNGTKMKLAAELIGGEHESIAELSGVLEALKPYSLHGTVDVDLSLMRGLDYYTGMVAEVGTAESGLSIGGGGRYDGLVGVYCGKPMPAVGMSIGIDRVADLLNASSSPRYTYASAFVATIKGASSSYAVGVAEALRGLGIAVDMNVASRNISNQLAYANALKFKYAVIIGPSEEKLGRVKLRNLVSGEESLVSVEEAAGAMAGS